MLNNFIQYNDLDIIFLQKIRKEVLHIMTEYTTYIVSENKSGV
jgi:hypothetical protein